MNIHGIIYLNDKTVGAFTSVDNIVRVIVVTSQMGATGDKLPSEWNRYVNEMEAMGYVFIYSTPLWIMRDKEQ